MLNKILAADARNKFANILNRVAYGKKSFVLTRLGEALAAIVSMKAFSRHSVGGIFNSRANPKGRDWIGNK